MRRALKIGLPMLLVMAPIGWVAAKLTVLNPAWMIRARYPTARIEIYTINSPDPHLWSAIAGFFGIPMADSDHALSVSIRSHDGNIQLDDFVGATEAAFTNCKIHDISAYWRPGVRLSSAQFLDCDFSALPQEQRKVLVSSDSTPGLFGVAYSTKQ
jgi:hypothetical protein